MNSTTYIVFLRVPNGPAICREVEVPDDYTDVERDAHLQIELDVMLHQMLETGWYPKIITSSKG